MKNVIKAFTLIFILLSACGAILDHEMTKEEWSIIDTLEMKLDCEIAVSCVKDFTRADKQYDFEIFVKDSGVEDDSLEFVAEYIAERYYPYLNHKDRYGKIRVIYEWDISKNRTPFHDNFEFILEY